MKLTVKSILDGKAATDDGAFPVKELFYMREGWALRYAVIDTGGWFRTDEVLVAIDRFAPDDKGGWRLNMTRQELDAAPVLDTPDPNLSDLPSLVVGPFGHTFSPLAFSAVVGQVTETADSDDPEGGLMRDGSGRVFHLDRVSEFLGLEAFSDDGALGIIGDIELRSDMTMSKAVLDNGDRIALSRLRRVADQGHALFS